jgi:hypothetical protein
VCAGTAHMHGCMMVLGAVDLLVVSWQERAGSVGCICSGHCWLWIRFATISSCSCSLCLHGRFACPQTSMQGAVCKVLRDLVKAGMLPPGPSYTLLLGQTARVFNQL